MRIQWADYQPTDRDAVLALHAEMEGKVGCKLDLPDLDKQPVLVCQVGRTNGVITHGVFIEAEVEACIIGPNPLPARELMAPMARLTDVARCYNLRVARCYVPAVMLERKNKRRSPLERTLRKIGFTREKRTFAQFFKWLVPKEERTTGGVS